MSIAREVQKLFIDFDGRQIEVVTDIPEAREMFRRTFGAMLVDRATTAAGRIEFFAAGDDYVINGLEQGKWKRRSVDAFADLVRHDVVRQFIKSRPDLLWLHAAAVEQNGSALLIVGPSGQGKSTVSTQLCERGWRLLSDDVAPIRMDEDRVLPFPQLASRRRYPGREFSLQEASYLSKEEVPLPDAALHREPAVVGAFVFPVFKNDAAADLQLLSEGEAAIELLRNCSSFPQHKDLAVERIARLARSVRAYRLLYGAGALKEFDFSALRMSNG